MVSVGAMAAPPGLAQRRDALLAEARPELERLARRLVWDAEEARDVVQSSMVEAIARWETVRDEAAASGWLKRIVVNRAYSWLRRKRFWNAVGALLWVEEVAPHAPDEVMEQAQHRQALAHAVSELPARQQLAFSLRYLEGWSFDEVATAMEIDRGTVRIHVQRAVNALRERGVLE